MTIWDLAHSAGAVPVDLLGAERRLRGRLRLQVPQRRPRRAGVPVGPSAPHRADGPRTVAAAALGLAGHAAPFEFTTDYRPAAGVSRFICGTPPILSLAALECGVDTVLAAEAYGGIAALREKSIALSDLFIELVEARCGGHGLTLVTPRDSATRGSQVAFAHPDRRLRDHAGAHRARRRRRLPRARHPALRPHAALHPVRRRLGRRRSPRAGAAPRRMAPAQVPGARGRHCSPSARLRGRRDMA